MKLDRRRSRRRPRFNDVQNRLIRSSSEFIPNTFREGYFTSRDLADSVLLLRKIENPLYKPRIQLLEALFSRRKRLLQAICETLSPEETDEIAKALYTVVNSTDQDLLCLIHWCIRNEIRRAGTSTLNACFRITLYQKSLLHSPVCSEELL